jgi:hypothetical protein
MSVEVTKEKIPLVCTGFIIEAAALALDLGLCKTGSSEADLSLCTVDVTETYTGVCAGVRLKLANLESWACRLTVARPHLGLRRVDHRVVRLSVRLGIVVVRDDVFLDLCVTGLSQVGVVWKLFQDTLE